MLKETSSWLSRILAMQQKRSSNKKRRGTRGEWDDVIVIAQIIKYTRVQVFIAIRQHTLDLDWLFCGVSNQGTMKIYLLRLSVRFWLEKGSQ